MDKKISIRIGLIGTLLVFSTLSAFSQTKSAGETQPQAVTADLNDDFIDCSQNAQITLDSSILASAVSEPQVSTCLFAGCAVLF